MSQRGSKSAFLAPTSLALDLLSHNIKPSRNTVLVVAQAETRNRTRKEGKKYKGEKRNINAK
jgi:hypothetical protein